MNIIHQEREEIIRNDNTAQQHLGSILERIKTFEANNISSYHELLITQQLNGTVDFSILEEYGFHNITTIQFQAKGRIVEMSRFPKRLTRLVCPNQMLVELRQLPDGLEVLECQGNYLETVDLAETPRLKMFNCADNRLQSVENIPPSIEEIVCDNNEIQRLDLRNAESLRVLHCSNNKTIVLEGFPPSIVDFKAENNPFIDAMKLCKMEDGDDDAAEDADKLKDKIEVGEALNQYFRLKQTYEKELFEKRKTVFEKEMKKSGNKKRAAKESTRVIAQCINCGRPVGTIFELKKRKYIAICGDVLRPCDLKIEIYSGNYEFDIHNVLRIANEKLEHIKNEILKVKMETVLDYIKPEDTVERNKRLLQDFIEHNKIHQEIIKKYEETMHGDVRMKCIREKQILVYEIIFQVDLLLKEYEKTRNENTMKTAIQMQVNELYPEIHNLQMLKYDVMEMTIHEVQKAPTTSVLCQKILSLEKHERAFNEATPRVLHFIWGKN